MISAMVAIEAALSRTECRIFYSPSQVVSISSEVILTGSGAVEKSVHMTGSGDESEFGEAVHLHDGSSDAAVLVVCEHASNRVPHTLDGLGLAPDLLESHIAWDPGALGVAKGLAGLLSAPLIHGGLSRLVYDCNRPPDAPGAVPETSEIHTIPGNTGLSEQARRARVDRVYVPFRDRLADEIAARRGQLRALVTVHSFTPVYMGRPRTVEFGVLHGQDDRLARAMLANVPDSAAWDIRLNEPYGPDDGVSHTLDLHGAGNDLPSVMLEIRNDLIATSAAQRAWADLLTPWLQRAVARLPARTAA
jgi:predicted N-formylglutamate amidohydrolase